MQPRAAQGDSPRPTVDEGRDGHTDDGSAEAATKPAMAALDRRSLLLEIEPTVDAIAAAGKTVIDPIDVPVPDLSAGEDSDEPPGMISHSSSDDLP